MIRFDSPRVPSYASATEMRTRYASIRRHFAELTAPVKVENPAPKSEICRVRTDSGATCQ